MAETVEKLRNIALVGHGNSGKTSLTEAILYDAGVLNRMGTVEQGNTAMDFEPEEVKRQVSISSAFHQFERAGHVVQITDTPGDQNFFAETKMSMLAADSVVTVIDALDGIKFQTEQAWEFAKEFNLPAIIFINKLDRERANFDSTFSEVAGLFTPKPIKLQIPIGSEASFKGVVDLISMKAYTYDDSGRASVGEIPADMEALVESEREALIENVAEADDALIEKYLEGEELSDDDIKTALRKGTLSRSFAPVVCGSATKNIGIDLLMDYIISILPTPLDRGAKIGFDPEGNEVECQPDSNAPFSAFVFKTITDPYAGRLTIFRIVSGRLSGDGSFYNVNKESRERYTQLLQLAGKDQKPISEAGPGAIAAVAKLKETTTGDTICDENTRVRFPTPEPMPTLISFAVEPKSRGDEEKIFGALSRLLEEDVALKLERNSETKQILLSGMGQVHIEATVEKLKRKFNVEVNLTVPKIPYRETIKGKARVQGKHKKQTGGHGQYGDCWIQLEPLPRGRGFEFVDAIVGGVIPKQYIPAVEKGIVEAAQQGVLAGFPCVDFKVTLYDGSYHAVDSSELAFKIAGSLAFKKAAREASPVLLEPIMNVAIIVPDEFMGDVMGDLNSRRGRVLGMESKGKHQVIKAQVPMAEFLTYAPDLNSMTGGRGTFTQEFSHYDEVPAQIAQKIIEQANKEK
ncbi:MAG: elongation factor G [Deltaproteobacteria bacterium]|nr:elongation factor G [Deltaproteobacteria bacterium]MBW1992940.1 elongation factor G [Deltaproteobacteria bacterium]MBW2152804.1 elongation factor G [Deltaproteobacteria bacterium]